MAESEREWLEGGSEREHLEGTGRADSPVWPDEVVEKAARALAELDGYNMTPSVTPPPKYRAQARTSAAVLGSEVVPKAEHEELWAENQRLASDHYFARAEAAEARAESLRAAIREHIDTVMPRDGTLVDMPTVAHSCEQLYSALAGEGDSEP